MIKVAIVGAGVMGGVHAGAYQNLNKARLIATVDIDLEKARLLADKYKAAAYSSMEELLNQEDIDVIDICLPTFLHKEYTIKAANAGKHILCEKPFALTLQQADKMIEAVKKANVKFMVAHVLRFRPQYIALKEVIDSGKLGRLLMVSAGRICERPPWSKWFAEPQLSGGAVIDLHIHDLDFISWLCGRPISIYAAGIKSNMEAWDHIVSIVKYENGVEAFAEASFLMPKGYPFIMNLRVLCERGCAEFISRSGGNVDRRKQVENQLVIFKGGEPPKYPKITEEDGYFAEIEYFIECVKYDRELVIIVSEEARFALELALAARHSAETGKIIKLSE